MFSDELIGLSIRHDRETRQNTRVAQAIIDELDSDIRTLRRKLAAAQGSNAALILERGRRNNAMLIERMRRTH